ncbi:MAG: SPOR domain-containing protein, partial [Proteobacteria bacterium]|nr:SPOR domain-containing protein [Pseudomonadota bacterium]
PELDQSLSARNIRQLRERITHSFYLNPLTTKESVEYIQFRIGAAGCPHSQLLTAKAGWLIAKASGGLTRRINILADKALMAAYADGALATRNGVLAPVVNWRHAYAAIRDSDYPLLSLRGLLTPLRVMSASIVLVVTVAAFLFWPNSSGVASQSSVVARLFKLPAGSLNSANELLRKPRTQPVLVADVIQAVTEKINLDDSGISPSWGMNIVFADKKEFEVTENVVKELIHEPIVEEQSAQAVVSYGASVQAEANDRVAGRSLIQEAAISWLRDDSSGYTVQFLSGEMEELELAETLLDNLEAAGMIEETYMCMRTSINRNYWTIKVGTFTGVSLAQQFVDKLPATMQFYKPYVQDLSGWECNANTTIAALILE